MKIIFQGQLAMRQIFSCYHSTYWNISRLIALSAFGLSMVMMAPEPKSVAFMNGESGGGFLKALKSFCNIFELFSTVRMTRMSHCYCFFAGIEVLAVLLATVTLKLNCEEKIQCKQTKPVESVEKKTNRFLKGRLLRQCFTSLSSH